MAIEFMDPRILRRRRIRNAAETGLLLAGMIGLLAVVGWGLAGVEGLAALAGAGSAMLLFGRGVSARVLLRAMGAQPLGPRTAPVLHAIVSELARRAGVAPAPGLCYLRQPIMLAFSVGARAENAVIALTDGLLRGLSLREIAGVLAHEISHIRHRDLAVMGLADMITRMTRTLSLLDLWLALFNLPMFLLGQAHLPWVHLLLLILTPQASTLMQLALSRTREYDADRAAAELTADPAGLAAALYKLEAHHRGLWERLFRRAPKPVEPSLLRSHPETRERIRRLLALTPSAGEPLPAALLAADTALPVGWAASVPPIRRIVRWWR